MPMRTCTIAAVAAVALLVTACGDDPDPPRDEPDVRLTLTGPADAAVTRSDTVEIAGNVKPARAAVRVRGEDVAVDGGEFRTEVELEPGANLIDVAASANGRRPDFAARRGHRAGGARGSRPRGEGGGRRRLPRPDPAGRPEGVRDAARGRDAGASRHRRDRAGRPRLLVRRGRVLASGDERDAGGAAVAQHAERDRAGDLGL